MSDNEGNFKLFAITYYFVPQSVTEEKKGYYNWWQCASVFRRQNVVKFLLELGVDVNAKNANGLTALMAASQHGHWKIVMTLLAAGADSLVWMI